MLTQLAQRNLSGDLKAFEAAAYRFEALPMHFLRCFGSTDVNEVLDVMEYTVYAYDVQHILLDNVQFMLAGQGRGFDKFERQDAALDKFRKFASAKNVHLTLVIHPRKEQEDEEHTLSSVFGTAKATQEADNVLILQKTRGKSKLDIRKNRFDDTLGSIPLRFDPDSASLREFGMEGMSESVAAVDVEAEMELAQRRHTKKSSFGMNHNLTSMFPDMASDDKYPMQEYQHVAALASASFNGVNGEWIERIQRCLSRLNEDDPDSNGSNTNLSGSSSHSPQGSPIMSDVNGKESRASAIGVEPFAAFTPIITR
ncbi:hypothetical protein PsorP6_016964 [Peronosclerospora sorghi]|uniref:Uncharacterized protein n=1 Tax=Peronosclerospora sorghi TaxID=230839 RepID=A0ACC0WG94_9STRA|nr:hypothetical protein PsorP6_016964 [Peronosclerospora sorghi]